MKPSQVKRSTSFDIGRLDISSLFVQVHSHHKLFRAIRWPSAIFLLLFIAAPIQTFAAAPQQTRESFDRMFNEGIELSESITGRRGDQTSTKKMPPYVRTLLVPAVRSEIFEKLPRPLEAILRDYQTRYKQLQEQAQKNYDAGITTDELDEQWSELLKETEQQLEQELTIEQEKRVQELSLWLEIKTWGLPALLYGSELGKTLKITSAQKSQLELFADTVRFTIQTETKSLEEDINQKLLDVLTDKQQSKYKSFVPTELWEEMKYFEMTSIISASRHRKNWSEAIKRREDFEELKDSEFPRYISQPIYQGDPLQLLMGNQQSEFKLRLEQLQAIKDNRMAVDVNFELAKLDFPSWADRKSPQRKEFVKRNRREQMEMDQQVIEEILDDEQREKLLQYHYTFFRFRSGPLCLLADSSLSKRLEITAKQRSKLFEVASEFSEMIEQRQLEIHNDILDQVFHFLDAKQKSTLEKALGDRPSLALRSTLEEVERQMNFVRLRPEYLNGESGQQAPKQQTDR